MEGPDVYNEMYVWDGPDQTYPILEHATTLSPTNNTLYSTTNELYVRNSAYIL